MPPTAKGCNHVCHSIIIIVGRGCGSVAIVVVVVVVGGGGTISFPLLFYFFVLLGR